MTRLSLFLLLFVTIINAQTNDIDQQRKITFPDIPGYQTLICDLHQHTVFSDGYVWPNVRVWEAVRDNLDAIAVTEHLEYQPHKDDIPHPDRNRAYHIEAKTAENEDLIVINGSEITRKMPPGHSNAIFVNDANKLLIDDSVEVFREARRQDAFVFWNHPNWANQQEDGVARLTDTHRFLIREGLLQGIEVVNDITYSDEALQIALDHNLTIVGTSDIHGLVDWRYNIPDGGHRPVTLVFSSGKSEKGIKEGLVNRRTVVYFENRLIGRDEFLLPLVKAAITIKAASYPKKSSILNVVLQNNTSCGFTLQNASEYNFHNASDLLLLEPHSESTLQVKTLQVLTEATLKFTVLNAINAPNSHPQILLKTAIQN